MNYCFFNSKYIFLSLLFAVSMLNGCSYVTIGDVPLGDVFGQSRAEDSCVEVNDLTPAERKLCERAAAFNKTVWQGALTGAVLVVIYNILSGGGSSNDAWINPEVGAAVGMLAGYYIASKKQEYANRKDILDSIIADIRQKNQQSYELIVSIQEVVAHLKREINKLNKQYQRGVITKSRLKSEIDQVIKRRNEIKRTITKATAQLLVFTSAKEKYEEEYSSSNTISLDEEIKILQNNIDNMREISKELGDPSLG